jgi:hypothetical protein
VSGQKKSYEEYRKEFRDYALDRGVSNFDLDCSEHEIWEAYNNDLELVIAFRKIF